MSSNKSDLCENYWDKFNVTPVISECTSSPVSSPTRTPCLSPQSPSSSKYGRKSGNSYYQIYLEQQKEISLKTTNAPSCSIQSATKADGGYKTATRLNTTKAPIVNKPTTYSMLLQKRRAAEKRSELGKNSLDENKLDADIQEFFKLRVPIPTNLIEKLCTTCTIQHYVLPTFSKPLVVLDLDKIIPYFTCKKRNPTQKELQHLHDFFQIINEEYNIAIWSAIKMKSIIQLLKKYSLVDKNNSFKICFCLDITSVVNYSQKSKKNIMIKPLEVIWNFYEEYHRYNTILVDNNWQKFKFVPGNEFIEAKVQQIRFYTDRRLGMLTRFLQSILVTGKMFPTFHLCLKEK